MLSISRATLYRRLEDVGISPDDQTPLSEQQLDDVIRSIKRDHPNDGEVLMQGHLLRQGIKIPRQELRDALHRVDHSSIVARQHSVIRRRVYSVPYPNFIWHFDSHHKLIRWRIVIHGAVDGFSRTIVYLKCADNNKSATVLDFFREGVARFGLPDSVRSDHGGENVGVWRYMIVMHNNDFSCVLTGSSVHNERIERLWRDVHRCVAVIYSDELRSLEADGKLDPLNEVDLYCLHCIYLPRISKSLLEFQESWNNHSISSEGSRTPYQLLDEGLSHMARNHNYSVGPADAGESIDVSSLMREHVGIPRLSFAPCSILCHSLNSVVQLPSSDSAKTLYTRAIETAGQHLLTCRQCVSN